jgi:release factor glutamine methyltransferase
MGDGEKGVKIQSALDLVADRLRSHSDTPELDAQVLLASVFRKPRSWLLAHPETQLDQEITAAFEAQVQRLEHGEPLPYVLGEWEFFNLTFEVTPDVLIPRPETELLVERAIAWLRNRNMKNGDLKVLDVGTGCGCIAIALAVNLPGIQVVATDISPTALAVARRNAEKLNVPDRVIFLEADLIPDSLSPDSLLPNPFLPDSFSLIVANLPYIPTATLHRLPIYTREPTLALDGGVDGLTLIRHLLARAPEVLAPGGMMLLEIEASQGSAAVVLAGEVFPQAAVKIHQDLSGHDRLIEIQKPLTSIH